MTYTYSIQEPTFADTLYNIESETPLTFAEAYARRGDCVDVEHGDVLDDAPVVIEENNGATGESKRLNPAFPLLDAFITKYSLTSISVVDVVDEGLEVTCWKGDDIIIVSDDEDLDQQTQGLLDVLGAKCGRYTEASGTLTPDDDGAYRFEGNVTKRVIL